MKTCSKCKQIKSLDNFFKNIKRKDGVSTYCKNCQLEYQRDRYRKPDIYRRRQMNREEYNKRRKNSTRKYYLKSTYGITESEYEALKSKYDGACWICNEKTKYHLHIDHDHSCCNTDKSCGKCIRGLLCFSCNTMLGFAKDNPEILKKAVFYIEDN